MRPGVEFERRADRPTFGRRLLAPRAWAARVLVAKTAGEVFGDA